MSFKESFNTFKTNFKRDYDRISKIGTWDSLSDAAVYISVVIFLVTLVLDLIFYFVFCWMLDFPVFTNPITMDRKQCFLLIAVFFHVFLTTLGITFHSVRLYDLIISQPVKKLVLQMKNINQGEMTDYLLSGKLSKPFATSGMEETWIDIVQGYVDTASSEKYLDELTGCFNRKYFSQVLDHHMKTVTLAFKTAGNSPKTYSTDTYAVFLIDIDFFKKVNDDFGHAAGDEVLKKVGSTLRKLLGDNGVVIRNGGEEFLVISSAKYPYDFAKTAEMINQAFRDNISVNSPTTGEERKVTCSIGYVNFPLYDGQVDLSLQNHVDLADQAMYLSKLSGRNTWHELVANKVPPETFDASKFSNDSQYGIEKHYLRVRTSPHIKK